MTTTPKNDDPRPSWEMGLMPLSEEITLPLPKNLESPCRGMFRNFGKHFPCGVLLMAQGWPRITPLVSPTLRVLPRLFQESSLIFQDSQKLKKILPRVLQRICKISKLLLPGPWLWTSLSEEILFLKIWLSCAFLLTWNHWLWNPSTWRLLSYLRRVVEKR